MELMDRERIARDTMAFWLSTDGCQYEFRFKTTLMAAPNGARFEVSRARESFTQHQDPQRPAVFSYGEGGHPAIGDHTSPIQAWRLRARTKAHLVSVFGCP